MLGGESFEVATEFRKGGGIFDDKVSGDEDKIGFSSMDGSDEFFGDFFIGARTIVEIGEVGDAEAI